MSPCALQGPPVCKRNRRGPPKGPPKCRRQVDGAGDRQHGLMRRAGTDSLQGARASRGTCARPPGSPAPWRMPGGCLQGGKGCRRPHHPRSPRSPPICIRVCRGGRGAGRGAVAHTTGFYGFRALALSGSRAPAVGPFTRPQSLSGLKGVVVCPHTHSWWFAHTTPAPLGVHPLEALQRSSGSIHPLCTPTRLHLYRPHSRGCVTIITHTHIYIYNKPTKSTPSTPCTL